MRLLRSFLSDDHGQGIAEYALIIAGVAILVLLGLGIFSGKLTSIFSNSASSMPDGTSTLP